MARTARLHTLTRLNQMVTASLDVDVALIEIAKAAADLTDAALVDIWLADEDTQTLTRRAVSENQSKTSRTR